MYMHVEASVWYMAIFLQSIFLLHLVIIPLTDATPTIYDMIYMTNNVPAAVRDGQGYLVHVNSIPEDYPSGLKLIKYPIHSLL